jgi:hypothetical protein
MVGIGLLVHAIVLSQVVGGEIKLRRSTISEADDPLLFWFEAAFLILVGSVLIYRGLNDSDAGRRSHGTPPSD